MKIFKKILITGLTYFLITLFCLPMIEIILSLVDPEQVMVNVEDPEIVYKFYPEREGIAFTEEYRAQVNTNSLSLRGCEEKSDNQKKKLLIIGDSFSEGWGVDCKSTYHFGLNQFFQVFNGAIHGGSMPYYILKVRQLQKLIQPDIILIQIFDNDLDDADKIRQFFTWEGEKLLQANPRGLFGLPSGKLSSFIRERSTFRLIKRIINATKGIKEPIKYYKINKVPNIPILKHEEAIQKFGKLKNISDFNKEYNGQFGFYKYTNQIEIEKNLLWKTRLENFKYQLNQLISETKQSNVDTKIVILYIPAKEALYGYSSYEAYISQNLFLQHILEITKENSIKLIDSSIILSKNPELYYFPGDAHLNLKGHEELGNSLSKELNSL